MKYLKTIRLKDGRECVLRNCTAEDAKAVLRLFLATLGQTDFLTAYPDEIHTTLEQEADYLRKQDESPDEVMILAEVDGILAGSAAVHRIRSREKTRHRCGFGINVDRTWWGLGIGRGLTEACIECAKSIGYLQMELEVVSENQRAIALYESVGFVEYGRNPKALRSRLGGWQENVLMRLELEREEHGN